LRFYGKRLILLLFIYFINQLQVSLTLNVFDTRETKRQQQKILS